MSHGLEVSALADRLPVWAASHEDVRAVALVGSWARGQPGPESDVDVVILTDNPQRYTENAHWPVELGLSSVVQKRSWGVITEQRATLGEVEVEFGIGTPKWANTNPVDSGTRRVAVEGLVVLYDPRHLLADLMRAISVSVDERLGGLDRPAEDTAGPNPFDTWRRRREMEGATVTLIDLYRLVAEPRGLAPHKLPLDERAALRDRALPLMWPGYQALARSERAEPDPIEIAPYDPAWPALFLTWRGRLTGALGTTAERIEHVGSTAVPGLPAKPIIDIQISVADPEFESSYAPMIESLGVQLRSRDRLHRFFRPFSGLPRGVQVHVCATGSAWERRHLLFREYLRSNGAARNMYLTEKLAAAEEWRDDRVAYADAKTEVINRLMVQAETWAIDVGWRP